MATLFNQTNVSPATSFSGSGSSGGVVSANIIQGASNINNLIDLANGGGGIRTQTGVNPLTVSYGGMADTRIELLPVGGLMIGFLNNTSGGGNPGGYWAVGNNLSDSNWGVNLNYLSSITANNAPQSINMNALVSTLATAYPGCVS